jgi:ParB-like chromosome segregation protein Spo0J
MKIEKVKLSEIKPNPKNPRLIKDEKFKKLVQSIKDFPQMLELRPIVVDENNIILGGNMRFKALKEAGYTEVSIVRANDLTNEQKDEFIVKDNVGFGEWDWDSLANEWDAEKLDEWGLDVPIFKEDMDSELKDLSNTIDNLYRIEIVCKDEEHQENTYNKLIEEGYECRLLTL